MRQTHLELMHDHVRAIHRAITGSDPPSPSASVPASAPAKSGERPAQAPTFDELARRFAELESLARSLPSVAERVPPFSFAPPLDLIGTERDLIIELGVAGVDRESVDARVEEDYLVVTGSRSLAVLLDGRIYLHAEIPRGPFRREVQLTAAISGRPRVEVEDGIVRVRLSKSSTSPLPQA